MYNELEKGTVKICDRIGNDIGLLMNCSSVLLWGVKIVVLIKGLLIGSDGLIDNNRFFS